MTCLYIKQLYSIYMYVYIALCENLHASMEAQLILNQFQVLYTKHVYSGYSHKKERKNAQNRKQNVHFFFMHICKHDVISDTTVVFRI